MKLYQSLILIFLFAFTFSLNSCGAIAKGHAKNHFTEESDAIPPEFGKFDNQVLLIVLKKRSSYDKYLKSAAKRYLGKYEFITADQIESEKYNQKTIYRYVFDYDEGSSRTVHYSGNSQFHTPPSSSTIIFKQFLVRDRLTNKTYKSGYESAYFGKAMKAYMENLELKRSSTMKI
ncbi:hypothetical protein RB619_17145 [Flavobacterium sp. LHD-80]|uniref:hypothetical protein n=1 Tax=Flavobacterium sp. LHD-80 TaxID=3071411 RepID=UPI0027E1E2DF|nr:hypothetical protein [Flavobacterium sp. LHD-80]MDQ6472376.1 hypothetical protein [Flavobacterium sp. LHD-80]